MGGSTPKASAVSMTMADGWPARFAGRVFGIDSSGYAARVFSVFERVVQVEARG